MLVGFLIAVVASTGTYFLMPPPRDADASFFVSRKDMWNILEGCGVMIDSGQTSQQFASIRCSEARLTDRH
jgi:hypothetical protein